MGHVKRVLQWPNKEVSDDGFSDYADLRNNDAPYLAFFAFLTIAIEYRRAGCCQSNHCLCQLWVKNTKREMTKSGIKPIRSFGPLFASEFRLSSTLLVSMAGIFCDPAAFSRTEG